MAKIAIHCADLGMTNLVTTLVMPMVTKFAWMGGKKIQITLRVTIVPKLFAALDATTSTDSATDPDSANVGTAGPDLFVTNVYGTPGANMVHVMNPGPAIVKKAGVVFSATKT